MIRIIVPLFINIHLIDIILFVNFAVLLKTAPIFFIKYSNLERGFGFFVCCFIVWA